MKSYRAILKRARKLRLRYAKKYVRVTQERRYVNCRHNLEHDPVSQGRPPEAVELSLAPREVTTMLVVRDDAKTYLCMYGSDDPANWPGDICDRDEVVGRCRWFEPRKSADEAASEFMEHLEDDEWVYENHRDLAALQWVMDDGRKVPRGFLSLWERFLLWLAVLLSVVKKPGPPQLPLEDIDDEELAEGKCDEELIGIWGDDPPEDSGA